MFWAAASLPIAGPVAALEASCRAGLAVVGPLHCVEKVSWLSPWLQLPEWTCIVHYRMTVYTTVSVTAWYSINLFYYAASNVFSWQQLQLSAESGSG